MKTYYLASFCWLLQGEEVLPSVASMAATAKAAAAELTPPFVTQPQQRLDTHARLIEHNERLEPKDYQSTTRSEFADPTAQAGKVRSIYIYRCVIAHVLVLL